MFRVDFDTQFYYPSMFDQQVAVQTIADPDRAKRIRDGYKRRISNIRRPYDQNENEEFRNRMNRIAKIASTVYGVLTGADLIEKADKLFTEGSPGKATLALGIGIACITAPFICARFIGDQPRNSRKKLFR